MQTNKKPVFKWNWQKVEVGDYTDIKEYKIAIREWEKASPPAYINKPIGEENIDTGELWQFPIDTDD